MDIVKNFRKIGKINLTQERVRQIEKKALRKLRHQVVVEKLKLLFCWIKKGGIYEFTKVEACEQCDYIITDSITQYLNDNKNIKYSQKKKKRTRKISQKAIRKQEELLLQCKIVIHLVKRKIQSPLNFRSITAGMKDF